ncbi:S-layer homology domain-containing protein [Thermodesulfitimonas autotrophica]|uniref:S-layer homology domain-containing protein n=1 Tax=Thermodesulfitimonas autotrophica TaxID=1894989 RepID=UPI000F4E2503|nr:S-layer homology domain-containing protein [Thermodesulfitimonas autotrophica]
MAVTCLFTLLIGLAPGANGAEALPSLPTAQAVRFLANEYRQNGFRNADAGVGAYAFYILKQAGVDVSGWRHNGVTLTAAVLNGIEQDLARAQAARAKTLAQDLAAAWALGREDLVDRLLQAIKERQTGQGFGESGPLSIYSNMPACEILARTGLIAQVDAGAAKRYILESQYREPDAPPCGSWGSADGAGFYADFMATAEAVRALHYLDSGKNDATVQAAIYHGIEWLRRQQKPDGSFVAGMDDPVIDTCEAIVTLKTLGIDPASWRSSAGKSPVDYLTEKALNPDGSLGTSGNAMDATWVLWASLALQSAAAPPAGTQGGTQTPGPQSFNDLRGHWAAAAIGRLAAAGIVAGYPDGTFRPAAPVTRCQVAAMLVRLWQPAPATVADLERLRTKFRGAAQIPAWAQEAVAVVLREGLMAGYPCSGSFCFAGARPVSRGEMAVLAARLCAKKGGALNPQPLTFTDAAAIPAWAREAVGAACGAGLISGYPDGSFRFTKSVTRAEAAVLLSRLAALLGDKT